MISKPLMTLSLVLLFLYVPVVQAQNSATTHVFPQIADGVWSDGSAITSRFVIASIGGFPATCSISLFGIGPDRLDASTSVSVPSASWQTVSTRGQDIIATGYARVDCSQPVFASLTYSVKSANGTTLTMATVSGAPVGSHALIPMVLNGHYRYAIAIANNNDSALTALMSFTANGNSVVRPIQVPPRSHYIAFVDEIFNVPADGTGTAEILANGSVGSGNFNVMALLFDQATFTSVVPAVI